LAAYRAAGLPGNIEALRADPDTLQKWTRYKSRYLVDFTMELADHVRKIRGPQVRTARNIYAQPVLNPESETWFAQNLDDFLGAYTWTAPMAMPWMENVPRDGADAWMKRMQLRGARSFGYYPDDFTQNQPELDVIRPAISNAWYPFQ
jgi:biofilm PGA synthesis lipoprotein PgaB